MMICRKCENKLEHDVIYKYIHVIPARTILVRIRNILLYRNRNSIEVMQHRLGEVYLTVEASYFTELNSRLMSIDTPIVWKLSQLVSAGSIEQSPLGIFGYWLQSVLWLSHLMSCVQISLQRSESYILKQTNSRKGRDIF